MAPYLRAVALASLATLLGGCALSQGVAGDASPSGAANPPAVRASTALPPNAFAPSPNHYFVASDEAAFTVGSELVIDGGMSTL